MFLAILDGNRKILEFWKNHWCVSSSFEGLFSSLYRLCNLTCFKVAEVGPWLNNFWVWDIGFNEVLLSGVDALLLEELLFLLHWVKPKPHEEDHFVWWRHKDGFSFKDYYKRICDAYFLGSTLNPQKCLIGYGSPKFLVKFSFLVGG